MIENNSNTKNYDIKYISIGKPNIPKKFTENEKIKGVYGAITSYTTAPSQNMPKTFLEKLKQIDLKSTVQAFINSLTITKGSRINWDPVRLLTGRHAALQTIGAEHIQVVSSDTGAVVDAHYLDASKLLETIEKAGGQRKKFQLQLSNEATALTKKCLLELGPGTIEVEEITISSETPTIKEMQDAFWWLGKVIVQDIVSNRYFAIPKERLKELDPHWDRKERRYKNFNIQPSPDASPSHFSSEEFNGFKFNSTEELQTVKEALEKLNISNSSWTFVTVKDETFLVRKEDQEKLKDLNKKTAITLLETPIELRTEKERGVVILSASQVSAYEQKTNEMLTFALEGMNVLAYNTPGKGLSTGKTDKKGIDASAEAMYNFLYEIKKIPDKKILAKGQCFGSAPSAYLGRAHPQINLFMDQNPGNFKEVAIKYLHDQAETTLPITKNASSLKKAFYKFLHEYLFRNTLITTIATALLSEYDMIEDLKYNKGHILFNVDVATNNDDGGDKIIPEDHLHRMIDSLNTENKHMHISFSVGSEHVTDWWEKHESKASVLHFLDQTGLRKSLFN